MAVCRAAAAFPSDPPAAASLRACVVALSRGAHAYHQREKTEAWQLARQSVADAVALLFLHGSEPATELAHRLEARVLPAIAGLLRRQERRRA